MLAGLLILLGCQLLGEVLVRFLGVPLPGSVLGLLLLFVGLLLRGGAVPTGLGQVSAGLIRYLALLFLPAGVGLFFLGERLRDQGLAILAVMVVGTVLSLALAGWLFQRLLGARAEDSAGATDGERR